jgi:hypothetical protein
MVKYLRLPGASSRLALSPPADVKCSCWDLLMNSFFISKVSTLADLPLAEPASQDPGRGLQARAAWQLEGSIAGDPQGSRPRCAPHSPPLTVDVCAWYVFPGESQSAISCPDSRNSLLPLWEKLWTLFTTRRFLSRQQNLGGQESLCPGLGLHSLACMRWGVGMCGSDTK